MAFGSSKNTNRPAKQVKGESLEREKSSSIGGSVSSLSKDTVNKVGEAFGDIGKGIFEQLLQQEHLEYAPEKPQEQPEQKGTFNPERGTIFSFRQIEEERQISEIKELIKAIKQEVESIKKADSALMSEVKDIEKLTIDTLPEKPGIYHVRFLEIVLKVLQTLKLKISESGTWMEALKSKKAKRGSAFAANTKKKGTQYSMSQELSNARNVQ
ncbi:hypothetical protein IPM65_05700 [Candidatus Roizmanbacteria bacterium]|nr:MAG: hypothetical protein IPM65_05700 [Candidatus Roizmanbacteria bacterium]